MSARREVMCPAAVDAAARSLLVDDAEAPAAPSCLSLASGLRLIHATAVRAIASDDADPREALAVVAALAAGWEVQR